MFKFLTIHFDVMSVNHNLIASDTNHTLDPVVAVAEVAKFDTPLHRLAVDIHLSEFACSQEFDRQPVCLVDASRWNIESLIDTLATYPS